MPAVAAIGSSNRETPAAGKAGTTAFQGRPTGPRLRIIFRLEQVVRRGDSRAERDCGDRERDTKESADAACPEPDGIAGWFAHDGSFREIRETLQFARQLNETRSDQGRGCIGDTGWRGSADRNGRHENTDIEVRL
jgi:hypothetical protein